MLTISAIIDKATQQYSCRLANFINILNKILNRSLFKTG